MFTCGHFPYKALFPFKAPRLSAGLVFIKSGKVPVLLLHLMAGSGKEGSLQLFFLPSFFLGGIIVLSVQL